MHADPGPHAASRDPQIILAKVIRCYTSRSGAELASLFNGLYAPDATFIDPFAHASPRQEALLQFLSLQHLFSAVEAAPVGSPVVSADGSIACDVAFKYHWARDSWIARQILPEVTPIDATVTLRRDAAGAIVSHLDEWKSPAVPALPTILRKINVRAMNAAFRLLGWEKELRGSTAAVVAAKEPQPATLAASKKEE